VKSVEGFIEYEKQDAERYTNTGAWKGISFADIFDRASDLCPKKEALVDDRVRLTYAQLREKVDKLAIGMMKLGIKKGNCVLVQLPNWAEFVYAYFAIYKIGAAIVLLVSGHSEIEVSHLADLTRAKAWIVPEKYRKINYLPVIENILKTNPGLEGHVILARSEDRGQFSSMERLIQDAELNESNLRELANGRPDPDDVAIILPTGGTTGLPKAAPRTHDNFICNGVYKGKALELCEDDITLLFSPVGHNLAINGGVNPTILNHGKLVLLDSTRPEDFCRIVQKEKVTYAPLVPALASRVVNYERLQDYDLSSLKRVGAGGQGSPPELINNVSKKIGCKCLNAFGMVEGATTQVRMDDDPEIVTNTAGRPVCPYDEFKVIDAAGKELPTNKEGELVAKGPCIFTGYLSSPEKNRESFTEDGFFRTGDLATIDDRGNVKITGRIKDIIIRGGENITASDVEGLIAAHPDVEDVAVIGMPDKELGERVCAYIRLKVRATKFSLEELSSFMQSKGASNLLIPERMEFLDEIPLTKVGKADKNALRKDVRNRLGRGGAE
jgi:2,3-dihydroxybenzoate-AMP ligase